jgi:mono/diheme cytochrome c family protein
VKGALLLLVPGLAWPQAIQYGSDVFAKTCAIGYCHGVKGEGGGAPKLAGRGFDEAYITSVTRAGIPGTPMNGYGTTLARPEFNAVVAYVMSLNGIEPRISAPQPRTLAPEAAQGRELFSDSVRGFARCSTCHQVDGLGVAVAPIVNVPASAAALRQIAPTQVRMAGVESERVPILVVSRGGRHIVLYDLTAIPPVLRTVDSRLLRSTVGGSMWKHASVLGSYSDQQLELILAFLRATGSRGD